MHLFYVPEIHGNEIILDETESKHAVRVLRLNAGDIVNVVDGTGGFYSVRIVDAHPKKCILEIVETQTEFEKRPFRLHMAVAPTKNNDRFEWFLEKATEIGIDEITPLICEHSERKILKPERMQKILVSAMKQSVKAYLPKLNVVAGYNEFIKNTEASQKFIAHCMGTQKPHLKNTLKKGGKVLILIGPEGDFSPDEVKKAEKNEFAGISLGVSRLRTETAAVVACHIVNLIND